MQPASSGKAWQIAARILRDHLVWDNHACMPLRPSDDSFLPQLERMKRSQVNVVSLNIGFGPQSLLQHFRMIASFRRWIKSRSKDYLLVETVEDIDDAQQSGRLGVTFDMEGLFPFDEGDDGLVSAFYDLGVRWSLIAYNRNNNSGGGCMDDDGGLTQHGRRMVAEMRRVGMVICCSHTGHRTARDILDSAEGPVIFSHSNAAALHPHERNISDELIVACAQIGGVIGVNGIGAFHRSDTNLTDSIVNNIDYIAQLTGPDHVAVSLDYVFDQAELLKYLQTMRETIPNDASLKEPVRLAPPESFSGIVEGLLQRGYREPDLKKILGLNWRRIAEQCWR